MSPHSEPAVDPTFSSSDISENTAPELIQAAQNGDNGGSTATNGHSTPRTVNNKSQYLPASAAGTDYDLICVGFGPASLAVAVALHDAIASGRNLRADGTPPKVLFVEKQARFAWHAGMLLPGAKMQISFVKDLATLRDPRSEFTFLNYLHRQNRLVDFTNLGTFLPARVEYEDYLRWCSSFFSHLVQFNEEVVSISADKALKSAVNSFTVQSLNSKTGQTQTYRGRNVLLATGGKPSFPKSFPLKHPQIIHSSQYAHMVPQILSNRNAAYRVVVVGAGQSAAEIFNNIHHLYPNSQAWLVMRQEFLKPSDDSPFVNSIFNPEYIDSLFPKSAKDRSNFLLDARATNYGVVRLELIEELYNRMYDQKREIGADERTWPHRILGGREITSVEPRGDKVHVRTQLIRDGAVVDAPAGLDVEAIDADIVIAATGYQRNAHVDMLKGTWDMLPKARAGSVEYLKGVTGWNVATDEGERKMAVGRDYRVKFNEGSVAPDSGIWLQGCCEGTHGLSDTLLSVLATRSGEIVDSIFGDN